MLNCCVFTKDDVLKSKARSISKNAKIPCVLQKEDALCFDAYLHVTKTRCELISVSHKFSPVYIDFIELATQKEKLLNKNNLLKAVGTGHKTIVDLTAGFGMDAFVCYLAGHSITMVEKNVLIHSLIYDALHRFLSIGLESKNNIQLECDDSLIFMDRCAKFDVAYIDTMFHDNNKSLSNKKMQLINLITKNEPNNEKDLFEKAKKIAKNKVIVKRGKNTPCIGNCTPSNMLYGTNIRFDIYS